jgi:hypothetical protein
MLPGMPIPACSHKSLQKPTLAPRSELLTSAPRPGLAAGFSRRRALAMRQSPSTCRARIAGPEVKPFRHSDRMCGSAGHSRQEVLC